MQTVPSLVGTGTAIAAAASGLVFGQPTDLDLNHQAPTASNRGARVHKRSISIDRVLSVKSHSPSKTLTLPLRRPATSSAAPRSIGSELHAAGTSLHQTTRPPLSRRQRPQTSQVAPTSTPGRRQSLVVLSQGDIYPGISIAQGSRESISSSGSWLKRLSSIRPLSQHGSPRSSILADSPSVAFSHGSTAPILSRSGSVSKPMSPNKLVKRSPSRNRTSEELAQRKSRGHLHGLRRPATSHQRSATLQQFRAGLDVAGSNADTKYSLEEPICPEELLGASPIEELGQSHCDTGAIKTSGWVSFFHSKTANLMTRPTSHNRLGGRGDGSGAASAKNLQSKRINPAKSILPGNGAHLIKPRMVSSSSTQSGSFASSHIEEESNYQLVSRDGDHMGFPTTSEVDSEMPPSARPRRSFSSTFSQTANWASKTSGSLRRTKRGASQGSGENKRHVSAPVRSLQSTVDRADSMTNAAPISPVQQGLVLDSASAATLQRPAPKRNASSPLPPLSNRSGVHADMSRRSPVSGANGHASRPSQPSGSSTSSTSAAMSQRRGSHNEKLSALDSSDGDTRDLVSGDEYDTDFKSDTLFDSLRTTGSARVRAVETPLESVYDESPPSTGGNKRSKRLSIQEILDRTWDEDSKIMEEDESTLAPGQASHRSMVNHVKRELREDPRFGLDPSTGSEVVRNTRHFGRFPLDDDFGEDWTRDDDAPVNALSPPSKGSSLSSSAVNPNVRLALATIGGNLNSHSKPSSSSERFLGNLFDWSEPSFNHKQDPAFDSRPKTAYGKQVIDSRGGRSVLRKGPMPAHVRSQSVPVVHDPADESKPSGSKYGTWGLGTKTVSEDWDEDFEFGAPNDGLGGKDAKDLFAVPESIRASQPSVKAHSGQIRELSLLVNDLKRLCRHARELDMLNGEQKPFWKEAEGIIALASPDEGSANDDDQSEASIYMDAFEAAISQRDEEDIDDSLSFDRLDAVIERNEPVMSKTAVVRERQSPRRRSVFSPDDDIFGANWPLPDDRPRSNRPSRPRTPENRPTKPQDVNGVVRSVIESVQHRSALATAGPAAQGSRKNYTGTTNRMHFDTNSLKVLVRRSGELRDILSDLIRRADQLTQSPARTPRHERCLDSSPAFTKVFDDPGSSPARRPIKSRGNSNNIVERPSSENSSPSNIGRRVPLMTVN